MAQLRRNPAQKELPLHVIDRLLNFNRPALEVEDLHRQGVAYDLFYEFDELPDHERRRLWQVHGAELRREARRRGLDVPRA
jgi:hypothetical protein